MKIEEEMFLGTRAKKIYPAQASNRLRLLTWLAFLLIYFELAQQVICLVILAYGNVSLSADSGALR
jgi:hypothetical protein